MSNFFFDPVLWPSNHTFNVGCGPRRTESNEGQALSVQHLSRSAKLSNSDQHRSSH